MTNTMKLGTDTGSLINHVYSQSNVYVPSVGEGATVLGWSDRQAATVVSVERKGKGHLIIVQYDTATRADNNGMSDAQEYEFTANPNGVKCTYRLWDDGRLHSVYKNDKGRYVKSGDGGVRFGKRSQFYDYSF